MRFRWKYAHSTKRKSCEEDLEDKETREHSKDRFLEKGSITSQRKSRFLVAISALVFLFGLLQIIHLHTQSEDPKMLTDVGNILEFDKPSHPTHSQSIDGLDIERSIRDDDKSLLVDAIPEPNDQSESKASSKNKSENKRVVRETLTETGKLSQKYSVSTGKLRTRYIVEVIDRPKKPVVSYTNGDSRFRQNMNPSWIQGQSGLVIRVQNCSRGPGTCFPCYGSGQNASRLVMVACNIVTGTCSNSKSQPIDSSNVIFGPSNEADILGTEDPRIVFNSLQEQYFMTYTAFGYHPKPKGKGVNRMPFLAIAKSKTGLKDTWEKMGSALDPVQVPSKAGAILVEMDKSKPDYGVAYLFWGDTNVTVVKSNTVGKWNVKENTMGDLIQIRSDGFDNRLVESGPPPLPLRDGNYLFFYNSAEKGWPHDPATAYNVGFIVLDGSNKTNILQRSPKNEPLLSPKYSWEHGDLPHQCVVPNVVFVEAATILNSSEKAAFCKTSKYISACENEVDLIRVYYGGADASIGTAVISIKIEY
mmetsp:Transcript_21977/g.32747  ORF Transcript_21977/g.32747 Transcript_21977/m.32747 type:complete len:531 (-) Transcript_21977:11-1603(-)